MSDRKLVKNEVFTPDVLSYSDYFPFGMTLPNRNGSTDSYRYGFQGQEKDDEIKGEGNSVNYKYRMHDPRVGRFFAVDPIGGSFPWNSPYAFAENKVIQFIELEGLEIGLGHIFANVSPEAHSKTVEGAGKVYENIEARAKHAHHVGSVMSDDYQKSKHLLSGTEPILFGTAQIYFSNYFRAFGGYTDAEDVSVLVDGRTIDGEEATAFDYGLATAGAFIPFVSGGSFKQALKGFWRIGDNSLGKTGVDYFFSSRGVTNFSEFYDKTRNLSVGERVAEFNSAGKRVAESNGWELNKGLTKKNNRTVYSNDDGVNFALDTEKGSFEIVNKRGKHQGEINFEGAKIGDADKTGGHDLIVK